MILYFSGTGNSKYVAQRLAQLTGDTVVSLNERMKKGDDSPLDVNGPLVLCSPVYAWRTPRIVSEYLEKTELLGVTGLYVVLTCGSGIGGAGAYDESLCKKKGIPYRGTMKVLMPENYIAMFNAPSIEKAKRIVHAAERSIQKAGKCIAQGEAFPGKKVGPVGRFLSWAVNSNFYRLSITDKPYFVKDSCISCGKCEEICPLNNVVMTGGKPQWQGHCTQCMACMNYCPAEAIEYGRRSKGKLRYYFERLKI